MSLAIRPAELSHPTQCQIRPNTLLSLQNRLQIDLLLCFFSPPLPTALLSKFFVLWMHFGSVFVSRYSFCFLPSSGLVVLCAWGWCLDNFSKNYFLHTWCYNSQIALWFSWVLCAHFERYHRGDRLNFHVSFVFYVIHWGERFQFYTWIVLEFRTVYCSYWNMFEK